MSYQDLIFGKYSIDTVLKHVKSEDWQQFRKSLKGLSTDEKLSKLRLWLKQHDYSDAAKVQVTNYVYSLKRAGLLR